ncbi:uncharacterized protein LOC18446224 isoform X2 [Amborella trichopoda]|nr:uncharacterized protein LOC18446224 isoform X2 [Amborella trichopoda]|eukprot:XP_020530449.1 uncharacterized protein LOC18446224 isoform X2 [Amborella trichopoda]
MDNMNNAELYGRVLTVNYAQPIRIKGGEQGWASQPIVEMAIGKVPELQEKFTGISDPGLDFLRSVSGESHHKGQRLLSCFTTLFGVCILQQTLFSGDLKHDSVILNPNQRITTFSICRGLNEKQWSETLTSCSGFDKNERNKILTSCSDFDEEQTIDTLESHRASKAKKMIKTLTRCRGFNQERWERKDWITVRSSMAGELRVLPFLSLNSHYKAQIKARGFERERVREREGRGIRSFERDRDGVILQNV